MAALAHSAERSDRESTVAGSRTPVGAMAAAPVVTRARRWPPRYAAGYVFVAPVVLYLLATAVYPIANVIGMSLRDVAAGQWYFVGVAHYRQVLMDPVFWNAFRNTAVFTIASTIAHLTLGMAFALLLHGVWFSRTLRNITRGAMILPWVFSTAAAGLMWSLLYHPFGLLNYLAVGVLGRSQPIEFLGDPGLALASVIAVNVWKSYPFYMVAILGELQAIPVDLFDAAKVDGAGGLQRFWYVTLPQLRGILIAVSTLDVITTFGHVDLINILTRGGPGRATETVAFHVYRTALLDGNLAKGSAISTIMLILLTLFTWVYLRMVTRRGSEAW
jgi:multiple sugar transport system permease protein